jgi:enoyl-CoA hydratase
MANEDRSAPVRTSKGEGVGVIELARPEIFNCLSSATLKSIECSLEGFEQDRSTRSLLIFAEGKNFCTGAELGEVQKVRGSKQRMQEFLAVGHRVLSRLEASRLPVIGAVQGLCLAGGLELALACDVLFAAEDARFGDQHGAFGLIPGWGGSQRLPRAIGLQRSLDLMFSARWISASTAEAWGLVSYVVPADKLRSQAAAYANKLVKRSAAGLGTMKKLAREGLQLDLSSGLKFEQEAGVPILLGADAEEGILAFQERRQPSFGGRVP